MTENATKNAGKTRGKPFELGNPGGPGRPEGSRNRATVLLDEYGDQPLFDVCEKMADLLREYREIRPNWSDEIEANSKQYLERHEEE